MLHSFACEHGGQSRHKQPGNVSKERAKVSLMFKVCFGKGTAFLPPSVHAGEYQCGITGMVADEHLHMVRILCRVHHLAQQPFALHFKI